MRALCNVLMTPLAADMQFCNASSYDEVIFEVAITYLFRAMTDSCLRMVRVIWWNWLIPEG